MNEPTRSGEVTRRAAPSEGTQPSETTDYRSSSPDSSAAQGQLGPDFHQRDEDNIDASRDPAATTTVRDRIVAVPAETVERYERIMADFDAMQNELMELGHAK